MLAIAVLLGGCADPTAPLPRISGVYRYAASSNRYLLHNRNGVIVFTDDNRKGASFTGGFEYTSGSGKVVVGRLIGGFIDRNHIWFQLLNEPDEYHESSWDQREGVGEILFKPPNAPSSGSRFTLRPGS